MYRVDNRVDINDNDEDLTRCKIICCETFLLFISCFLKTVDMMMMIVSNSRARREKERAEMKRDYRRI